ncbi:MAG: hypothetical protein ACFFCW_17285 [Candidatus Hodarchaeota archaeon]
MFQRLMILKKWEELGLKNSRKKKVRDFIEFVEKNPKQGWQGWANKITSNYYDVLNDLIPPLMNIGSNIINLNLIRYFDPINNKKVENLLKEFIKHADPQKMLPTLEAIAKLKIPSLNNMLKTKKALPLRVRVILWGS